MLKLDFGQNIGSYRGSMSDRLEDQVWMGLLAPDMRDKGLPG